MNGLVCYLPLKSSCAQRNRWTFFKERNEMTIYTVPLTDLQVRSRIDYQTLFDRCTTHCLKRKKIKWNTLIVSWTGQEWSGRREESTQLISPRACAVLSIFIKQLSKIRNTQSSLKTFILHRIHQGSCGLFTESRALRLGCRVFPDSCLPIAVFGLINAFWSFGVGAILTSHPQFCL